MSSDFAGLNNILGTVIKYRFYKL